MSDHCIGDADNDHVLDLDLPVHLDVHVHGPGLCHGLEIRHHRISFHDRMDLEDIASEHLEQDNMVILLDACACLEAYFLVALDTFDDKVLLRDRQVFAGARPRIDGGSLVLLDAWAWLHL